MPIIKKCLNCQIEMAVKPSHIERKKYCSKACKGKYQSKFPTSFEHLKKGKEIACHSCQKSFYRKKSEIVTKNFCSLICRNDDLRRNSETNNQHLIKRLSVSCLTCDVQFQVIESRKNTAKYCSRKCLGKANGKRASVQLRKRINVNCTQCQEVLERKPSGLREWNFCNTTCMAIYYENSGAFAGKNNGAWLGGDENYYGPNWLSQRRKARKRDNYICQECGVTELHYGKELSVHHKKRFKEFFGDWFQANKIDNLESLCEPCHRIRHKEDYKKIRERLMI